MKINEIITPKPQCISPNTTLAEAATDMKTLDVGILPICENDRLVGTITDRDITVRAVAEGYDPKTTKVEQVMSRGIICCFEDQDVEEAAETMEEGQIRRLPVLNRAERLVGIISLGDLAIRATEGDLAGRVLARVSAPAS